MTTIAMNVRCDVVTAVACWVGMLVAEPASSQTPDVTAFVDVAVIPMDRERVLTGQTVLVRGSRIAAIGPTGRVKVPRDAVQVDGRGKVLLPGLADMHTHVWGNGNNLGDGTLTHRATAPDVLLLYLANGVTTIRILNGDTSTLALRERVAKGELLGPRLYTAGPQIDPNMAPKVLHLPATAAQAKQLVAEQKAEGYDFIKLHNTESMKPEVLDTLAAAAHRARLPFAGHTPGYMGLGWMLRARAASVEHLTGYLSYLITRDTTILRRWYKNAPPPDSLLAAVDESQIPVLAAMTKRAGVWNCPTLIVVKADVDREDSLKAVGQDSASLYRRLAALRGRVVKALHDAGAGLLLGTDGPGAYGDLPIRPISEIQVELQMMVDAGLTPYQALETTTRNVATFLGTRDSTGTIAVGKRADLVLLPGNPLVDLAHTGHPVGVMLGGRWFSRADLKARLTAAGIPDAWYPG